MIDFCRYPLRHKTNISLSEENIDVNRGINLIEGISKRREGQKS